MCRSINQSQNACLCCFLEHWEVCVCLMPCLRISQTASASKWIISGRGKYCKGSLKRNKQSMCCWKAWLFNKANYAKHKSAFCSRPAQCGNRSGFQKSSADRQGRFWGGTFARLLKWSNKVFFPSTEYLPTSTVFRWHNGLQTIPFT